MPLLIAEAALTVEELLLQVGQTEAVISVRYWSMRSTPRSLRNG